VTPAWWRLFMGVFGLFVIWMAFQPPPSWHPRTRKVRRVFKLLQRPVVVLFGAAMILAALWP
jgi:hypothetical protein